MSGSSERIPTVFDLPEGSLHNCGVAVCQYLDVDGEMKFAYAHDPGAPLSTILGLLEAAKLHIYGRSFEED